MRHWFLGIALVPAAFASGGAQSQLLVTNARVLDVRTGNVAARQTIVIDAGRITRVIADTTARRERMTARDTIDAGNKLVTPGLVDAHFHSGFVLGDSLTGTGGVITHLVANPDSITAYRLRIAKAYIPHGITLVRDLGSPVRDVLLLRPWNGAPDFPDFLPAGAQLISPERGRIPPPFQVAVKDARMAAGQVRAFHSVGIRNIKLYWRLNADALEGGLREANRLGMNVTAHIDQRVVTFDRALELGVRQFEHAFTIAMSVLTTEELESAAQRSAVLLGVTRPNLSTTPGAGVQFNNEQWNLLGAGERRVLAMIEKLRSTGSTMTPTVHLLAKQLRLSESPTPPMGRYEDVSKFSDAQFKRAADGYRILLSYVAQMDARGVKLAVGSDTPEPGRGVLDEIIQLQSAGIPTWRVFRIATLQSAEAVGAGAEYGAIEPGRKANLVLFDKDPLVDIKAVLGGKTVIKDGRVVSHRSTGLLRIGK